MRADGRTLVAGCLALAGALALGSCDFEVEPPGASDGGAAVDAGASWPMFRGDPSLSGLAPGGLPDRLRLLWRFKTRGPVASSAVVSGGRVFIGSTDGNVYAIDLASGRKVWAFETDGAVEAPPLVLDDTVYVGSSDSFFYALDARTGRRKWRVETGEKILGSANWVADAEGRARRVIVGSYDYNLYCLDAATGREVWAYESDYYINGSPAVLDGKAVFGGCDAVLHVVDLASGSASAQVGIGSYIAASAALAGKFAYVGHYGGQIAAVDLEARKIVWEYGEGGEEAAFFSSAAVTDRLVVVGSRDGRVHAIDRAAGEAVWTFETGDEVDSSPVVCGDKVVVGSNDGFLYMLRLADGAAVWKYEVGGAVAGSPAVAAQVVIVGAADGNVFAFGPE